MLCWLADARYRDIPMPRYSTIAGFVQSVSTAVRERDFTTGVQWREYGEYADINVIPLAPEGDAFAWVPDSSRFCGVYDETDSRRNQGNSLVKSYCQEMAPGEWRLSLIPNPDYIKLQVGVLFYFHRVMRMFASCPDSPLWSVLRPIEEIAFELGDYESEQKNSQSKV